MADPMTPERLAEIREHVAWTRDRYNCVDDFHHAGARAVLDLMAEVDRLRAELAETQRMRDAYLDEVNAWHEFAGELLNLMPGAADVGMDAHDQIPRGIEKLTADQDRIRTAWNSARRGRRSARLLNAELIASMELLRNERDRARDTVTKSNTVLGEQIDRAIAAEAERDEAREQVQHTERAVHAFFADADQRGVHLDGMTVDELCDAVMAAIRKGPGR